MKAEVVDIPWDPPIPGENPRPHDACRGPPRDQTKHCKQAAAAAAARIDLHQQPSLPSTLPTFTFNDALILPIHAALQPRSTPHSNGKQPSPNKLPSPLLPITLRPAPDTPQRGALPLLHDRYLALHIILDANLLWCITSHCRQLCCSNALSKLEFHLVGAVAV